MPEAQSTAAPALAGRSRVFDLLLVAAGALAVALASQVAVPLPGTPVPMTLQPFAVLLVGGLLGARRGAASLVFYLALGASGLPVFTPVGAPGLARLLGPTGGYLLAYPFAAALVGWLVARRAGWTGLIAGPLRWDTRQAAREVAHYRAGVAAERASQEAVTDADADAIRGSVPDIVPVLGAGEAGGNGADAGLRRGVAGRVRGRSH